MVRRLEAKVTLEYLDEKTAEAITKAVSPDNYKTPAGLEVKTTQEGNAVVTEIVCKGELATFNATIDDLLFCANAAEKTLNMLKEVKQ
jgi:tRNA threonylcarbamoyladenosine modification (KEOPS) complex  Pcc1 subunit